ncbi:MULTISPECIES: hypothetical protein [unclassified Saccharicrinis]|uniref:hypothetical protein n=1 Tax=unclassified Saccharicrinis TaxID=2646859 RepID=UPI003D342A49
MEIRRVNMLFDALSSFYISNYYKYTNDIFRGRSLLPSSEEIKQMVLMTTKTTGLDVQQEQEITELFLKYFNQVIQRVEFGMADENEIIRIRHGFEKEMAYFFGEGQHINIKPAQNLKDMDNR